MRANSQSSQMIVCANISCKWSNDSDEDENTGMKKSTDWHTTDSML